VSDLFNIESGTYELQVDNKIVMLKAVVDPGIISNLLIVKGSDGKYDTSFLTIAPPNSVHILWQIPQIIIITAAEIMFSITGLEFSFTQAPQSMKSVLSAVWLLNVALGNVIVVFVEKLKFFENQAYESLQFAALMALDMLLFVILCIKYKYVNVPEND